MFFTKKSITNRIMKTVVVLVLVSLFVTPFSALAADKYGLDSSGRIVAQFGSPVIDGKIDDIWSNAKTIKPKYISNGVKTTATFKVMWDDNALYVLAQVKDSNLSVQSNTPYQQDSFEIFMDEKNDKTKDYGVDDLHFRVNYNNEQTVDNGDGQRFYTSTKKTKTGYVVEARIAFTSKVANKKVIGIDLQINDAVGSNRVGTINVFDSTGTGWNDTTKFGEVILKGKTKDSVSGLNPYDLKNLIKSVGEMDLTQFKNASVVTDVVKAAEKVLATKNVTQKKIDAQYKKLKEAINKLELTEEAASKKEFKTVPVSYKAEIKNQGSIEQLVYSVPNLKNGKDTKKLNVYLPYGYKATDKNTKYNVLYLMHGGGENENLLFGGPGQNKELKKILDNMIANGDIEPLIVVTPTFNGGKNDATLFYEEFINNVIPLVETTYNTYTKSADPKDLKESRDHRAFGGFSMGSVTTWSIFINCLDYVKYYLPLSGDCWVLGQTAGKSKAKETAEYLAKVAKDSGYTSKDYYIFAATGDADIAYPNMAPQIEEMKKLKDAFIFSGNLEKGNFYFIVAPGGTHAWNWVNQYIYDILPDLFRY